MNTNSLSAQPAASDARWADPAWQVDSTYHECCNSVGAHSRECLHTPAGATIGAWEPDYSDTPAREVAFRYATTASQTVDCVTFQHSDGRVGPWRIAVHIEGEVTAADARAAAASLTQAANKFDQLTGRASANCCDNRPTHAAAAQRITASAPRPGTLRDVLAQYSQLLVDAGVFAGLCHEDAHTVAATISWDALMEDDGPAMLLRRAEAVTTSQWGGWHSDRAAVASALAMAAYVLEQL